MDTTNRLYTAVKNPLSVVDASFENLVRDTPQLKTNLENARGAQWNVRGHFEELFSSAETYHQIPYLNLPNAADLLPEGTLVRYRGMIQDMRDPEYYPLAYHKPGSPSTLSTAKYRERIPVEDLEHLRNSPSCTSERLPLYCVPIPGENAWIKEGLYAAQLRDPPTVVRELSAVTTAHHANSTASASVLGPGSSRKRTLASIEPSSTLVTSSTLSSTASSSSEVAAETPSKSVRSSAMRKHTKPTQDTGASCSMRTDESESESVSESQSEPSDVAMHRQTVVVERSLVMEFNRPLDALQLAIRSETDIEPTCLVKVYGKQLDSFKLNTAFEFVGVLSFMELSTIAAPLLGDEMDEGDDPDRSITIPCLHAISYRPVNVHLPLSSTDRTLAGSALQSLMSGIESKRQSIVRFFASTLGGDLLAAEYLLIHLLSSVHFRVENEVIGKHSFNLVVDPTGSTPLNATEVVNALSRLIQHVLPNSVNIPLTLATLNSIRFLPVKNYERERLDTAVFQLVAGSHLLWDETGLEAGKLNEAGLQNVNAISKLLREQSVCYDFQYHQTEMHVDYPSVVVSTAKSLFKCDCILPVRAQAPSNSEAAIRQSPYVPAPLALSLVDMLELCREYFGQLRQLSLQTLCQPVATAISERYAEMRRQQLPIELQDLSLSMSYARLFAISHGESEVSYTRWQSTFDLEQSRKARLKK